jgi:hypothetical protein
MEKQIITRVNNTDIIAVRDANGEILVPIKPICTAIGVDPRAQRQKLQEDPILSSVGVLSTPTGADGKTYEMVCLPLQYIYGWIFTINPKNVAEHAREAVTEYRRECYDALYRHFAGSLRRQVEANEAEIAALQAVNDALAREKEAKADRRKAEDALAKIRSERLNPQPTLLGL